MSCDGLQAAVVDCGLQTIVLCRLYCLVLSCTISSSVHALNLARPGPSSHTTSQPLCSLPQCAVCPPRLGLLGDYPGTRGMLHPHSPVREVTPRVVGRHPRVINHQPSVINPHRGTISQSLTCQERLSGLQEQHRVYAGYCPSTGQTPLSPAVTAISGTSCLERLASVPAAIRAGDYPAHDKPDYCEIHQRERQADT